jgi:hypothetical protein
MRAAQQPGPRPNTNSSGSGNNTPRAAPPPPPPKTTKPGCVFCDLRTQFPERILCDDGELFAFYDRAPAARLHILVCPVDHIANVRALKAGAADNDAALVRSMQRVGERLLLERAIGAGGGSGNAVAVLGATAAAGGAEMAATAGQPWWRHAAGCCCAPLRHLQQRRRRRQQGGGIDGSVAAPAAAAALLASSSGSGGSASALRGGDEEKGVGLGTRPLQDPQQQQRQPQLLFGFHKPPWTSVSHLHMHCFLLPLKPHLAFKYASPLNWVEADALAAQLERRR